MKITLLIIFCSLLLNTTISKIRTAPEQDKIVSLPGYPTSFNSRVFAGYLKTDMVDRSSSVGQKGNGQLKDDTGNKLHYVFIQSYKGQNNTDPITLWLGGGPGCSSKLSLLQQIGPYILPLNQNYKAGQDLIANPYSWLNLSNLLFIDGPVGVGFSVPGQDQPTPIQYNDKNTMNDYLNSILYFFNEKFPQYRKNNFNLAASNYGAKNVADLCVAIENHNAITKNHEINIAGIIIGNPVMSFKDGSLQDSQIEFMIKRHFIDPKLVQTWNTACRTDPVSAGCRFFYTRYEDLMRKIDPYNIYGQCHKGDGLRESERTFMKEISRKNSRIVGVKTIPDRQGKPPPYTSPRFSDCGINKHGIQDYFNINKEIFNTLPAVGNFSVCNSKVFQAYQISQGGSISSLESLVGVNDLKVYMYSGDWDSVVPFTDTLKNIKRMGLIQDGLSLPWMSKKEATKHIGFIKKYAKKSKVRHFIVKGAGMSAPSDQGQKQSVYQMFTMFLQD